MTSFAKNMVRTCYRSLRANLLHRIIPRSQCSLPSEQKPVVEVIGFFRSISGIGESARLCAQQLAADGYAVKCTSVESFFRKPDEVPWEWPALDESHKIQCRIYHLNPPMLPPVILQMGLKKFKQTYNIGYWAWELEIIPAEWQRALGYMNAVFTPSEFTSRVIRRYTAMPVETVTHPVTLAKATPGIRGRLGIPEDAFLVSNIFSFGSALERKNPSALVAAFCAAFNATDNAYLVLKANAGEATDEKKHLQTLIGKNPNIQLIDQHWPRADVLGLIQSSSVYASLHRSEGFGLTIAEAMLLGTPALVTAWSGNMDFCTTENSFLLPFRAVPVNSTHPEFKGLGNASWADADVVATTNILQEMFNQPELLAHKRSICAQQMQACINHHKYHHALERLQELFREEVKSIPLVSETR